MDLVIAICALIVSLVALGYAVWLGKILRESIPAGEAARALIVEHSTEPRPRHAAQPNDLYLGNTTDQIDDDDEYGERMRDET